MFGANLTTEEKQLLTAPVLGTAFPGVYPDVHSSDTCAGNSCWTIDDGQLLALESFHQPMSTRFADTLSNLLRHAVHVELESVATCFYSQFALSRANPTCLITLEAPQLAQPLAMEFSPQSLYPILDCVLGGGRQPCVIPDRPLTEIEQRLARRVAETLMADLQEAWEPVLAVTLSIRRIDSNAQRVRVVPPHEHVVTLVFQCIVAEQSGSISLCLPVRAIQKMIDKLVTESAANVLTSRANFAESVIVQGILGTIEITANDVRNLKSGDLIYTDLPAEFVATVLVNGLPKFEAHAGSINGFKAAVIQ
jgi:flagellar motor switch protein FliM